MAMKKNVSGQKVGAQMITAADGSEFTGGSVTVYVTGDAGSQATGSVGSGAATHEGHGYWTYAPAQAETDYDLVAFTFVGSGAITVTVHERPDTVAADLAALAAKIDAIDDYVDTEVAAIKAATDILLSMLENTGSYYRWLAEALEEAPAGGGGGATAEEIADAVWAESLPGAYGAGEAGKIVGDNLNATVSSRAPESGGNVAAIKAVTDKVNETLQDDSGVYQFTAHALELAPSGTLLSAAWQVGTALPGFGFAMRKEAAPGEGAEGLTVTAQRWNGSAFEACENSPTEIGNGAYAIDFEIEDSEASGGRVALFRFSAPTALDTFVTLILAPAAE